jgi:DNA-binding NarL/FixJ family response regulator
MPPAIARKKKVARREDKSPVKKARIMLVDDHEMLRRGLRLLIEHQADLEVCGETGDEQAAIKMFRKLRPDLLVVDLSLKEGDGIDLLKRIRAIDPGVRVLIYSMHDERIYGERALRAGARGYVSKQQNARTILQAIGQVLSGAMHFSGELTQRVLERAAAKEPVSSASPVDSLSDRELEVFEMIGRGRTTRDIANRLHLSPRTIDTYRERLKVKLSITSAAELHHRAVLWAVQES